MDNQGTKTTGLIKTRDKNKMGHWGTKTRGMNTRGITEGQKKTNTSRTIKEKNF